MKTNKELFLTTGDVARRLNRSSQCVLVYERKGRLQAIKSVNGWRFFREKDVARLAAELSAKDEAKVDPSQAVSE